MREFFGSVKFKIFVVVACILIGLMLRTAATGGVPTIAQNVLGVVISPLQSASARISDGVSGVISNVMQLGSLRTQNEQLKAQVRALQSQMVDYDSMKSENADLRSLADITQEKDDRKYALASVISHDTEQWFSSFTIDKGQLAGIKKDDPVITSDGALIGVVVDVMPTTSVIDTILDPSVHVGCMVSNTGDTGVTAGVRELMANGEFELQYLSKNSSVTTGDIVITTGYTGFYPKNLQVGTVQKIEPDVSGNSETAILKPMVDPTSVTHVSVITDFSGKDTNTAPPSTDSSSSGGK